MLFLNSKVELNEHEFHEHEVRPFLLMSVHLEYLGQPWYAKHEVLLSCQSAIALSPLGALLGIFGGRKAPAPGATRHPVLGCRIDEFPYATQILQFNFGHSNV